MTATWATNSCRKKENFNIYIYINMYIHRARHPRVISVHDEKANNSVYVSRDPEHYSEVDDSEFDFVLVLITNIYVVSDIDRRLNIRVRNPIKIGSGFNFESLFQFLRFRLRFCAPTFGESFCRFSYYRFGSKRRLYLVFDHKYRNYVSIYFPRWIIPFPLIY